MSVTAALTFQQGVSSNTPGKSFKASASSVVTIGNNDNTNVTFWEYILLDVPRASALSSGLLSSGSTPTTTLTPDVPGSYRVMVTVQGPSGRSSQIRNIIVPTTRGWVLPSFLTTAAELDYPDPSAANDRGWASSMEEILLDINNALSGGGDYSTPHGGVAITASEIAALATGATETIGTTFSLAANRTYLVDVEIIAELDGPTKSAVFTERRIFRTSGGVVTANAQEPLAGPTDSPLGGGLVADIVVAITFTGTTGRVDVTNNTGANLRVSCVRQIRYLETNAAAIFDLATYSPSLWIEGDDLTQGGGTVSAFNNKGTTGVDPTVSAEQPTYNATNASYNNRPTWKCVAGGAAASYIQAAAAAHGLTTGPYTIVIVGQCKDANYALGTPSGNTAIAGGGGSGNKWQGTSNAANYLASGSGVADNPSVMAIVCNGDTSDIYVNSVTPTAGAMTAPAGTAEDLSASNVIIGNYGAPTIPLGADGDTALVAFFPADKTADLPAIINGLGTKFGITIV